jgi:hypothetical protein
LVPKKNRFCFGEWEKGLQCFPGKWDRYTLDIFPNNFFYMTKNKTMTWLGTGEMRLGQAFCKALSFGGFTCVSCGVRPTLHQHPSYKLEAMTFCKLETWVLYKMVALTSPGICTGGYK